MLKFVRIFFRNKEVTFMNFHYGELSIRAEGNGATYAAELFAKEILE